MTRKPKRGGARPGAGRPPGDPSDVRARVVRVPVSTPESEALDAWAEREGRPLAALLRETGLRAASRH